MKTITPRRSFDSARYRITRAKEHLTDLNQRLDAVAAEYRYAFLPQYDPNPPHNFIVRSSIGRRPKIPVPPGIAILIGETCYNLRCALDYLVFALSFLNTRRQPTGTQFPTEGCRERFDGRRDSYLKGVSDLHVAMIERLQPYNGTLWTAQLRDFNDLDKHNRFINIGARAHFTWGDNAPLPATYVIKAPPNTDGIQMNMNVHIAIEILFNNGVPVGETLQKVYAGVTQTLADFYPEFPR